MGDDFEPIHEFNMRITFNQCHELVPKLAELKFHWIEEPVDRWGRIRRGPDDHPEDSEKAIDWNIKIREAAEGVPMSGGNTMAERSEFKDWIERDAFDFVQLDCDTTGLIEGWYIAQYVHLQGKPCITHNWHGDFTSMSNIRLVAAIPNYQVLEPCRH